MGSTIEFKDGKPNGQGTMTLQDGSKYVGEHKDGIANGQGTYTWFDDKAAGTRFIDFIVYSGPHK